MQTFQFLTHLIRAHFIWAGTPYFRVYIFLALCLEPVFCFLWLLVGFVSSIISSFILRALSFLFPLLILRCACHFCEILPRQIVTQWLSEHNRYFGWRCQMHSDNKSQSSFLSQPGLWMIFLHKMTNSGKTVTPELFLLNPVWLHQPSIIKPSLGDKSLRFKSGGPGVWSWVHHVLVRWLTEALWDKFPQNSANLTMIVVG